MINSCDKWKTDGKTVGINLVISATKQKKVNGYINIGQNTFQRK